jgi:hypothetical protein
MPLTIELAPMSYRQNGPWDGRVPLPKVALLAPSDREGCNRNRD